MSQNKQALNAIKPSTLGIEYRGTVSVTKNGLSCQPWALDSPNKHNYNYLAETLIQPSESACRGTGEIYKDPNGLVNNLWCYTTDPDTRWENCDVSDCSHDVGQGDMFRLWMNLFHVLKSKKLEENEIMKAIVAWRGVYLSQYFETAFLQIEKLEF